MDNDTKEIRGLQVFSNPEFGAIRALCEGDKVLFCGSDVAKALGYAVPRKALFDHCKGVLKRCTLTNGGEQEMSFIPESDVYRLVFGSKLPTAEKFTDWVTEEVLPSIRSRRESDAARSAMETAQCIRETPITIIGGVACYEKDGMAYLKLETVARGLGFTQSKGDVEYVRWETVDRYLREIGFPNKLGKGVTDYGHDGYIPENVFYRLAMKAKNEAAEKFQAFVADEVIPSI